MTLLRHARLVPVGADLPPGDVELVDVRVRGDRVVAVAPGLSGERGDDVLEVDGRWLIPGLWDAHVHLGQWARLRARLDVSGTASPREVIDLVARRVQELAQAPAGDTPALITGYGFRSAPWDEDPTVAALDAVSGAHPVVLISGDAHNGWLNTAALRLLGVAERDDPLRELAWFEAYGRLVALDPDDRDVTSYREAEEAAAARGIVGIVDMDFGAAFVDWTDRFAAGVDLLRIRTAAYPDELDAAIAAGLRSGRPLADTDGLVTMGPLKIISDGSLNTRTAYCCAPYGEPDAPYGVANYPPEELTRLMGLAHAHGLEAAVHAIGDAAVAAVTDAFERTGAAGSVEHLQLARREDLPRLARAGIRASVQPAHLLDDRDVTARRWGDRADRCFLFASMLRAGMTLRLGSDAPVAPLDPWLAMAAAVHRSADERPAWNPDEALTPAQALAASTDGRGTVAAGSPADLVLLDRDPLAPAEDSAAAGAALRTMPVAATLVAGRVVHDAR